jgi:Family of unknown function (DUF5681)
MSERDDETPSYEVGRGRPPKHTRFAKGASGNPQGRPKGSKNLATSLRAELRRRVTVTEDGRRKMIGKQEAVAKQLVNKAAAGDLKAIPVLLNEMRLHQGGSSAGPGSVVLCRPEDQLVMANIVKRIREIEVTASEAPSQSTAESPNAGNSSPENGGAS